MDKVGNADCSYAFDKLFKDNRNRKTLDETLFNWIINMSKKKISVSDEEYNKNAASKIKNSNIDSSDGISTERLVLIID